MLGLEEVIGLEVISSDARVVGTVEGVGIDIQAWKVPALKVGLRRGVEETLGKRRHMFAVEKVYISTAQIDTVSDTVILRRPVSAVSEVVIEDESALVSAGALMGMRVICCNARYVGMVDNMVFDPEHDWSIPFLQVKLDREAVDSLNMRHPFLVAPVTHIRTSDVRAIGDMVMMSITLEELRSLLESRPTVLSPEAAAGKEPGERDRPGSQGLP